jgi:hypothetical protein
MTTSTASRSLADRTMPSGDRFSLREGIASRSGENPVVAEQSLPEL